MSNQEWLERSRAAVWHPCTQMKRHERLPLVPIERGQGVWLYDFDGRRYLDAVSSWWVNLFGHCHPAINAALIDQLGRLEHAMLAGFTHAPVVELSERLSAKTGGRLGHAFYGSDGASATEIALKMSFHYWRNSGRPGKTGFVSLVNGYHGETIGALAVTDVALFKDTYAPLLRQTAQVPSPDERLAEPGEPAEEYALRCAAALERHLAEHHESIAALILEPLVQGAAGMAMYHPAYLAAARELCDRYAVHLIADEIAVGFGRTGTLFACEQAGISPDFLCLSKGLTGGQRFRLSASFGLFQFIMPVLGWFAGRNILKLIEKYDHWVAAGLLVFIGGRMIFESFRRGDHLAKNSSDQTKGFSLIPLPSSSAILSTSCGLTFSDR